MLLFTPLLIFGQTTTDTSKSSCKISTDEIYSIIKFIIKKEKLNKKYGIQITASQNCSMLSADTNYLQTLLIKPKQEISSKQTDTAETKDIRRPIMILQDSCCDKQIFTQADIDYILCSKQNFKQFKWDNKKLAFNAKNKKEYYSFSVPCFSITHDKAIIMYEYLCKGLCGSGRTLILNKKNAKWNIDVLELWFH